MQKFYSDQVANNRFPDKVRKLVSEQQGSQARFPSRAGFQAKSRKKRLQGGSKQQVPKASFGSRAPDKVSGFGRRVPKKGSQVQLPKQCCTHGYPTLMQHCNNTNSFAISINLRINRSKKNNMLVFDAFFGFDSGDFFFWAALLFTAKLLLKRDRRAQKSFSCMLVSGSCQRFRNYRYG